jgi:hypothetical protein
MRNAVSNVLQGLDFTLSVECPTGSCRWPPFTSLAVCSASENISRHIKVACDPYKELLLNGHRKCNYTFGNHFVHNGYGNTLTAYTAVTPTFQHERFKMAAIPSTNLDLANFVTLKTDSFDSTVTMDNPEIFSCRLSFCARTFINTTWTKGITKVEQEVHSPLKRVRTGERIGTVEYDVYEPTDTAYFPPNHNRTFSVNVDDLQAIRDYLENTFTGNSGTTSGNRVSSFLWASPNISTVIENLAVSMTNVIRNGDNNTRLSGLAENTETYIHVHWYWLLLPAFVVLSVVAFLTVTIVQTARQHSVPWKSSTLAFLFHRLEGWDEHKLATTEATKLLKIAERMRVRLVEKESGERRFMRAT